MPHATGGTEAPAGTAETRILLLAESEGNCPFQGHWSEVDISICLPDVEMELNHNPLEMDNLGCQFNCIQKATETRDARHSCEVFS